MFIGNLYFAALKCDDKNAEYQASGPGCPATCLDPNAEDTCTLEPTEGCFCKDGFVMSAGACVPQAQCGCRNKKGDYFPVPIIFHLGSHLNNNYQICPLASIYKIFKLHF